MYGLYSHRLQKEPGNRSDYFFNTPENLQTPFISAGAAHALHFSESGPYSPIAVRTETQPEPSPSSHMGGFTRKVCEQTVLYIFCLQEMYKAICKDV